MANHQEATISSEKHSSMLHMAYFDELWLSSDVEPERSDWMLDLRKTLEKEKHILPNGGLMMIHLSTK